MIVIYFSIRIRGRSRSRSRGWSRGWSRGRGRSGGRGRTERSEWDRDHGAGAGALPAQTDDGATAAFIELEPDRVASARGQGHRQAGVHRGGMVGPVVDDQSVVDPQAHPVVGHGL